MTVRKYSLYMVFCLMMAVNVFAQVKQITENEYSEASRRLIRKVRINPGASLTKQKFTGMARYQAPKSIFMNIFYPINTGTFTLYNLTGQFRRSR